MVRTSLQLLFVACIAFAIALPAPAAQVSEHISVHFAPKPAGDPDGIDTHLVNFFGRAKKDLVGCFYEIRDQKFVDALIAAKKRGVDVRILVDDDSYHLKIAEGEYDRTKRNPFVKQLLDAGIEVRQDKDRSALMHNKFCVVDGRWVWSGSVNLTDTYATNANNGVEVESPKLAGIYFREFDKKFVKQLFGAAAPSYASEQNMTVDGVRIEVLFAPEDDPMSRILVLLNGAKKNIYFMQFAFTAEDVTTILLTKFKAGLQVGGIFDRRLYRSTGPYGDFSTLTRAGVPVQLFHGPGLFHHKVFIIDAGTPHAKVITGSQNSSQRGNNNNDENVMVLHSQKIAELYMAEYNRFLKETSQVTAEAVYDKDPVVDTTIPKAEVHLAANGVAVKRIQLEYPARWPIDPKDRAKISFWRHGQNVTKKIGLEFYGKGFRINNPGMTPSGANSVLEVHFKNMKVGSIAGIYNLYVSAVTGASEEFLPVKQQPTIVVKEATAANSRAQLANMAAEANKTPKKKPEASEKRVVAEAIASEDAFKEDIADQISKDNLTGARAFVDYLESMAKDGKKSQGLRAPKAREIRRALRSVDPESSAHTEAQTLLQRLEKAAAATMPKGAKASELGDELAADESN